MNVMPETTILQNPPKRKPKSIVGETFHDWTVIADAPSKQLPCGSWRRYSLCECKCGAKAAVDNSSLRTGISKRCVQCGLVRTAQSKVKHGMCHTKTYEHWKGMMQRATNENNPAWENYGGRGITVCDRWRDFRNFFADMGEAPNGLKVERIDNSLGYFPGNCKWATPIEQARNTRKNRMLTACGVHACFSELCERFQISYGAAFARLKRGWNADRIFSTPVRQFRAKTP
jgi:hypothetical protein